TSSTAPVIHFLPLVFQKLVNPVAPTFVEKRLGCNLRNPILIKIYIIQEFLLTVTISATASKPNDKRLKNISVVSKNQEQSVSNKRIKSGFKLFFLFNTEISDDLGSLIRIKVRGYQMIHLY